MLVKVRGEMQRGLPCMRLQTRLCGQGTSLLELGEDEGGEGGLLGRLHVL